MPDTKTATKPRTVWLLGHRVTLVPMKHTPFLLDIITSPGVPGPPPHYHEDAEELFYVVEGALDVMVDGDWFRLEAGETATVPKGGVHSFKNPTDRDTRWFTAWKPQGFEQIFGECGIDAAESGSRERSVSGEEIARFVEACGRVGMVIVEGEKKEPR